jgi:hypothetical protein
MHQRGQNPGLARATVEESMDPNKMYILEDQYAYVTHQRWLRQRARAVQGAVRAALVVLNPAEHSVIVGYYFDGWSFPRLANSLGQSLVRVRAIHRRALLKLEVELAPFAEEMFGIRAVRTAGCPICQAEWRAIAERLLDEKTPDMTWGQVAGRIERATGWRPSTPRTLTTHQKHHRRFVHTSDTEHEGGNSCNDSRACTDLMP